MGAAEDSLASLDSEVDARVVSVGDDVVRDQVAMAVLDPDPVAAAEDVVSGDHVVAAGAKRDAVMVSHQAVVRLSESRRYSP